MKTEVLLALLAICGTIAGTILGWLLNNASKAGKLTIYMTSWENECQHNSNGYMVPSKNAAQVQYFQYLLSMDLYNSSGETKILRDIQIVFSNSEKELLVSIPHDEATKVYGDHYTHYYDVEPINIPPKTVVKYQLSHGYMESQVKLDLIWQTRHVFLRYTDEKNRIHLETISKEDYSRYFETHKLEE